jgi:translocation and assembly module TamB
MNVRIGRITGFLLKLASGLALGALLFVLGTSAGLRIGLDLAGALTHNAIRYQSASGRLLGQVELEGFAYDDEDVRVEIDHARLALMLPTLLMGRVQLRDLDIDEARVAVKRAPTAAEPSEPFTHLPFPLVIDHAAIGRLRLQATPESDWLDFNRLDLSAAWFDDIINVDHAAAEFMMFGPLQARGRLQFLPDGLRIEETELHGPGDFTLNMLIDYDDHFEADAEWADLRWPASGETLMHSAKGGARAAGQWDRYEYAVSGAVRVQGIDVNTQAQGRGSLDALEFSALSAKLLSGEVNAKGRVQWSPQLRIDAEGKADHLNPAALQKEWPGSIGGQFRIATDFPRDQPRVKFDAALRDSQLRGYPLNLDAHGSWREGSLQLDDALLQSGASSLHVRGQALPPFDLNAQLRSPDLGQLWPGLHGRADFDARLRGALKAPVIGTHGEARDFSWQAFSAKQVRLDADLDPRGESALDLKIQSLRAGTRLASVHLHGAGTAEKHALNLDVTSDPVNADLAANGALDLQNLTWRGALSEGRIAPAQLAAWTLQEPAGLSAGRESITLEPACWRSDSSRACFKIVKAARGAAGVAFRLEDFALAYFKPFMPPDWAIDGRISGTGNLLSRNLDGAHVDIETSAGRLSVGQRNVLEFLPSRFKLDSQDRALGATLDMPLSNGKAAMHARLAPGEDFGARALSGQIDLDLPDLGWLRLLTREIDSATGHLHGQLILAGSARDPAFNGSVQLDDGRLRLVTPGIELSPLNLHVTGNSEGSLTLNADATSGGGTLKVAGTLDTRQTRPIIHLDVKGDGFQALNTPEARIWVAPDLHINVDGHQVDVIGDVTVPKAEITPTSFDKGIGPSSDQIILTPQGAAPPDQPWLINASVGLKLGDHVRFEGFGLKAPLTGAVTAIEQPGRPTSGRGTIDLTGGHYKAYGQDLTITTGRLIFDGGPITQPAVEIRAERKPTDDITVGVYVRGTLDAPQFSLFSTPTMPQEQQLSWLVLGRSLDNTASSSDRSAIASAAFSLSLSGSDFLAQKVVKRIGVDEISVGSKPGEDATLAKLTLGKYLSPKLFVSYGVGLFQRGYSFRLQYDIGHGFKLQTETGVESGGDLLYSIER